MPRHSPCALFRFTFRDYSSHYMILATCSFTRLDSSYIVCMVSRVVSVIDLSITNFVVSSFALHLLFSFQGTFAASFGVCSSSEQIWKDNFFLYLLKSALNWWAQVDSNHRPHAYQACALTCWAMSPCLYLISRIPCSKKTLVEMRGIEPLTPCLQSRCSPSWAIPP